MTQSADQNHPGQSRLTEILDEHRAFRQRVVPLCAAETPVSDYVRSFMSDSIHETYAMGGPRKLRGDNFAGAEFVLDLHQLTIDLCESAFGATYADPRPHSGTGAVTNALMTLSEPGQRILLQTQGSGGHASMLPICERLGLEVVDLPYDFDRFEIDYAACGSLDMASIDFVLYAPSDLIYESNLGQIDFDPHTIVIHDATQTLGLIASRHHSSPVRSAHRRTLVSGGTHKTLPGPSSGLLLTNDEEIADRLDSELSPKFVRHAHPHHTAALCATLIEHDAIGKAYGDRIQRFAHRLTDLLIELGLSVLQVGGKPSQTHQIFLHIPSDEIVDVYSRMTSAGLTMNMKSKPLFRSTGLRIGVQEIARYRWEESDLETLSVLLADVIVGDHDMRSLQSRVLDLAKRNEFDMTMQITDSGDTLRKL